jgi:hypothetical protein
MQEIDGTQNRAGFALKARDDNFQLAPGYRGHELGGEHAAYSLNLEFGVQSRCWDGGEITRRHRHNHTRVELTQKVRLDIQQVTGPCWIRIHVEAGHSEISELGQRQPMLLDKGV